MERLSLLLIDNNIDARMRLRHAVSMVEEYGETTHANNLSDARERLSDDGRLFDLVFVSYDFPRDQITRFIQEGKQFKSAESAAFIMLYPANEDRNARVSEGLLAGVDGFLFEPFSIDELVTVGKLAAKMKERRAIAREMISVKFMIKDLVSLIDVYARLTAMQCDTSKVKERLHSISRSLGEFNPQSQASYLEMAIDAFILQPTPDPIFERIKAEEIRSKRTRQKLAENLVTGIEQAKAQKEEIERRLPARKVVKP